MNDLALFGIIIIYLIITVAFGFVRGVVKSRIRVITVASSALVAFLISLTLKRSIVDETIISQLGGTALSEASANSAMRMVTLTEAIVGLGNALVMPLVYLALFFGLCFISWIIHLIVTIVLRRRLKQINERANHKLLQIILYNLLEGIIVAFVVLVPVSVYSQTASTVVDVAEEVGALEGMPDVAVMVDDYIDPINDSFLMKAHRVMGGNLVSHGLTDFVVNGSVVRLDDEAEAVSRFAFGLSTYADASNEGLSSDMVRMVADSYEDSVLVSELMSELVYELTDAWKVGEGFMEIERPDTGELFDPLITDLINILHTDSQNSSVLRADLYTIADIIDVMKVHDVFDKASDDAALKDMVGSNGFVKALTDTLEKNATMRAMIPTIKNIGMRAIATSLDLDGAGSVEYDDLMRDISGVMNSTAGMNDAERVEAITDEFEVAFADAGVAIDRDVLRSYSVSFIDQFKNDKNVTPNEVSDFFMTYALENGIS